MSQRLDNLRTQIAPWAPLLVLLCGACLLLPGIASFGLWDPYEVRVADLAKEALSATGGGFARVATQRPPLSTWTVATGFKLFGVGELGGRLPLVLAALAAIVACWYVGRQLLSRRGALFSALALLSMPAIYLGARQLTGNVMPTLASLLAVGGLASAAWPRPGRREALRLVDLALALVGLVMGYYASGAMLGVALPLTAVTVALLLCGGPVGAWGGGLVASLGAWGLVAWAFASSLPAPGHTTGYSSILGGTPHPSLHTATLVTVLLQIGFGAFPWVAMLPFAAARTLSVDDEPTDEQSAAVATAHGRFGRIALLAWLICAVVVSTLFAASVGEVAFSSVAAVALLVGGFLADVESESGPLAFAALGVLLGAVVIGHDFFLSPEKLAGVHVLEGIRWPSPLRTPPFVMMGLAIAWGVAAALALVARPGPGLLSRLRLSYVTVAVALFAAAAGAFWIVPEVSKHLSYRGLFTKYKSLGGSDGELGQYRVPGHGAAYYNAGGHTTELASLPQLFEFLGKPARVFVIVGSEDAAPIDQWAKSNPGAAAYYVVDDSNAHFLLLSNRLTDGEKDINPLKRQIVASLPRPPQHEVHATFENKIELVGYDLPNELERGRQFKITLYYKVLNPVGGAYKVFLHFDGPGTRFNGDHIPLEGRFPTNYWVPGFYIVDEHLMEPDRTTAPSGWYQIYTGLFMGDQRLKAVAGPNDGENRVKIGAVRVK